MPIPYSLMPREEQEAWLRALDLSMAIIELSRDGIILHANRNYLAMSGYTEEDLLHQHHRVFCTADEAASNEYAEFWRQLRKGRFMSGKFCRRCKDGRFFWVQATYNPLFGLDGQLEKVVKFATDITKRAETSNEQASKLAAINRAMLTAEFSPQGIVLDANHNFLACLGYGLEEVAGRHHRIFCPPSYAASGAYADFWKQLVAGNFISGQVERVTSEGKAVWLEASYNPVFDLSGRLSKIVKYSSDVTERIQHEQEEHRQIQRLSYVADRTGNAVLVLDRHGRVEYVNTGFILGYGYQSEEVKGKTPQRIFGPLSDWEVLAPAREAVRSGQSLTRECLTYGKLGQRFWSSLCVNPLKDDDGEYSGAVCMITDITGIKMQQVLQQKALEAMGRDLSLAEVMGRMCREMENVAPELRVSIHGISNGRLYVIAAPGMPEDFSALFQGCELSSTTGSWGLAATSGEVVSVPDISLALCWEQGADVLARAGARSCCTMPVMSGGGQALGVVTIYSPEAKEPDAFHLRMLDAVAPLCLLAFDREQAKKTLRQLEFYDVTTGLPNRALLLAKTDLAIGRHAADGTPLTVLCISIDEFKRAGEALGHGAANALLRLVGERLAVKRDANDVVGRMAGDEFVVILPGRGAEEADRVARRLLQTLSSECVIEGMVFTPSVSVGISVFPENGHDAETLLRHANLAALQSRRHGGGQISFFSDHMNKVLRERVTMEACLRDSLLSRELRLNFQPQIDLRSGKLYGVEALARWTHPQFGKVPPDRFIPLAEESGLIRNLTQLVLEEACRNLAEWRRQGIAIPVVSVNLSPADFRSRELPEYILNILERQSLRPEDLIVEITEGILLDTSPATMETIIAVRKAGFRLSMDDFGTGYSSLSYLRQLPVTELKLDQSFVRDIHKDETSRNLSKAVIHIGESMGLTVIAEGVETEEQLSILCDQKYHVIQGFWYSAPLPGAEIPAWVKNFGIEKEEKESWGLLPA